MTMFKARGGLAEGFGMTQAEAVSGLCEWHVDNNKRWRENGTREITIIEFRVDDYFPARNNGLDYDNPEKWAESVERVEFDAEYLNELGERRREFEQHFEDKKSWFEAQQRHQDDTQYWLRSKDTGTLVGCSDTLEKAKEGLEEVNAWEDGEEYEIVPVGPDEEMKMELSEVNP